MFNCVRETLCTHCIHRGVCSIKTSYLETLNKLPCVPADFTKMTLEEIEKKLGYKVEIVSGK